MAVAKSYQNMKQTTQPYLVSGRMYVKVLNEKTGAERQVRWYTDAEYAKMYPEDAKPAESKILRSQKSVLGFDKGYITIFKGDTYANLEWFQQSIARYTRYWGWYIVSTDELPDDIPEGVTPVQLPWELVGTEAEVLKPEHLVIKAVESIMYDAGTSDYVGNVGDRLTLKVAVTAARAIDGYFGHSTAHTMEDENGNVFVWITGAKNWPVGAVKTIKGTVKEHKEYRNVKQTVLTRCTEV